MEPQDLDAWDTQEPPRDFAGRVVAEAVKEQRAKPNRRSVRIGAAVLLATTIAAAAAMVVQVKTAHAHGDVAAAAREEVRVGTRAIAVLEPGAHVSWDGDLVAQSGGDVFWRVEPGARFTVHTPAADVQVKGTCFRVKVEGDEGAMNGRDVKVAAVGAVIGVSAFVGVYEGKVAVSHAGQSVDLTAGQSARAGADGVARVPGASADMQASPAAALSGTEGEKALTEANANLADNVRLYRRKLEALEGEKKKLEKQLDEAQTKLADGGVRLSEYDLSQEDLKQLAQQGEVRMRVPCGGTKGDYSYTPGDLNKLGLAPQDGPIIQQALQQSHARTWAVLQPLCSQALGGLDVSKLGQQACMSILMDQANGKGDGSYDEDVREVAEILAGTRPQPAPGAQLDPMMQAYLALARESHTIESSLAQSMGPDDAQRAVYGSQGCWWNSSHGVGPRGGD
jgi:hypothetical protein